VKREVKEDLEKMFGFRYSAPRRFIYRRYGGQGGRDYYQDLGVDPIATKAEINRAYRKLVLNFAPDRNPTDDPVKFQALNQRYQQILEAGQILRNDVERSKYDLQRRRRQEEEQGRGLPEAEFREFNRERPSGAFPGSDDFYLSATSAHKIDQWIRYLEKYQDWWIRSQAPQRPPPPPPPPPAAPEPKRRPSRDRSRSRSRPKAEDDPLSAKHPNKTHAWNKLSASERRDKRCDLWTFNPLKHPLTSAPIQYQSQEWQSLAKSCGPDITFRVKQVFTNMFE